jgi:hypothetical protein
MSDVARMRELISQETVAAKNGIGSFALVANHAAITARMERMADRLQALFANGKDKEARSLLEDDNLWTMQEEK